MWPFKSPKESQELSNLDLSKQILEELETARQFFERLELAEKDIVNLNTALNRVERKQSRWIELLNEKEDPAKVATLLGENPVRPDQEPQLGEEITQGVNYAL